MVYIDKTETWVVDKFKNVFHFLTYSSIYLSIAGGAMVYISCATQHIRCSFTLFAIMFLVTFSVYNLNRKTDEEEDSINHLERFSFTKKYEKTLYYSALVAYFFSLLFAMSHGIKALLITSIPLICGILYSCVWIPKEFKYRRLKEIPGVKNFVVAIAWALTPTLLPTQFSSTGESLASFVIGAYFFSLVFINSVICDMRDIEGDAFSGVNTIPVMLGEQKTKTLLAALNLFVGLMVLMISIAHLSPIVTYLLAAGMIYAHLYIFSFDKVGQTDILCDMIVDGQFIILGGMLYIATKVMDGF
ncbi:MAG: UbiA family prenyltransferase [Methanosarcinaceae archaeon]|nr:UbiA family prenyltransferase [Methanosarcinaceae archaeon]